MIPLSNIEDFDKDQERKKKVEDQLKWKQIWDAEIQMRNLRNAFANNKRLPSQQFHKSQSEFHSIVPKSQQNNKPTFITNSLEEEGMSRGIKGIRQLKEKRSKTGEKRKEKKKL